MEPSTPLFLRAPGGKLDGSRFACGLACRYAAPRHGVEVPRAALQLRTAHRARSLLPLPRARERPDARRLDRHPRDGRAARSRGRRRHRAAAPRHRGRAAPHPALPPAPRLGADRRHAGLGGRRRLQPRLPRASHQPAAARRREPAAPAGRARDGAAPRPRATALGDVGGGGPRGRPLRAALEGAPLHDRRRLGRRPDERADEPVAGRGDLRAFALRAAPRAVALRAAARRDPAARAAALRGGARRAQAAARGRGHAPRALGAHARPARDAGRCPHARRRPRRSTSASARTAASTGW